MNNSRTGIVVSNEDAYNDTSNSRNSNNNKNNYEQYLDLQDEDEEENTNASKTSLSINSNDKNHNAPSDYPLDQFLLQEDEDEQHDPNSSKKTDIAEVDAAVAAVAKIVEQEQQGREDPSNPNNVFIAGGKEQDTSNNVFAEVNSGDSKNKKQRDYGNTKQADAKDNIVLLVGENGTEAKKVSRKRRLSDLEVSPKEGNLSKRQRSVKNNSPQAHNRSTPFIIEEDKIIDNVVEKHCNIHHLTLHDFKELIWKNDNKQQKAKTLFWKALMEEFPKRTRSSLYKHVKRRYNNFKDRGRWTAEEDLQLKNLCIELSNQWSEIGKRLGRMPEDCRDRFRNYLKNNENKVSKPKNKWEFDEEQQLSELVDALTLKSFKVYLMLIGEDLLAVNAWCELLDQVSSFNRKNDADSSALERAASKNKDQLMESLVFDSVNFNKQQPNAKELVSLLNSLRDKFFSDNYSNPNAKLLSQKINENMFLMDLQHVINWTFLSDLLGNGRSRIQIRYKWKNVIKSRYEVLRSSKEWADNGLFTKYLKVIEQVSNVFSNGKAYEDEIDWFYVYKLWRDEVGTELSNDLFLNYRCDPLLMREIYDSSKQRLLPVEGSTLFKDVVKRLLTLSDQLSEPTTKDQKTKSPLPKKANEVIKTEEKAILKEPIEHGLLETAAKEKANAEVLNSV